MLLPRVWCQQLWSEHVAVVSASLMLEDGQKAVPKQDSFDVVFLAVLQLRSPEA